MNKTPILNLDTVLLEYTPREIHQNLTMRVARYSFSGSGPPKFDHKRRRHKQRFEKIATTVVLDKDENLL